MGWISTGKKILLGGTMFNKFPTLLKAVILLAAIMSFFLFTSPVYAQDEVPPEISPTETAPAEAAPTDAAPVETLPTDVAPVEVPPTEDAPVEETLVEPAPVEEAPAAEPGLAEALDAADVVLADANGEPLQLASQDAEELITDGDPYFTVGTKKYTYLPPGGDCDFGDRSTFPNVCDNTQSNPIQAAIDAIAGGLTPNDKTLYFEAATFTIPHIAIIGVAGLNRLWGAVDPTTGLPTVTINVDDYIEVMWQPAGFTMFGFNINGDTTSSPNSITGALDIWHTSGTVSLSDLCVNNSDSDGIGITIVGWDSPSKSWNGPVVLEKVDSSNNGGGGVYIDNYANSIAPVMIKNSSFNDNDGNSEYVNGITIKTRGVVTLDGVSANGNLGTWHDLDDQALGALQLNNSGNLTIKNSVFKGNDSWAINTVENINGTVSLDNVFSNENHAGIGLTAKGNITANNVHANDNDFQGAVFDTCWDSDFNPYNDSQSCTNPVIGNITITNSEFNNNLSNFAGLSVFAKGAITLTNVDASDNRGYDRDTLADTFTTAGARLQNYGSLPVYPVTVNNSTFNWNSDDGLEIRSKGLVTINKVAAGNNSVVYSGSDRIESHDGYGIDINNTFGAAGVTFNGINWSDNSTLSNAHGLRLDTKGAILLNSLDSSANTYTNAQLTNNYLAGNVTINKSSFNGSWLGNGLDVDSFGVITLSSVYANQNYGGGANLDNSGAGSAKAVTITNSFFSSNQGTGLYMRSKGAITLRNAQAFNNSVHEMDFPTGVYTVHDVFGLGGGEDLWTVDVTVDMVGISYNAVLGSVMANGIIEIRDPSGETDYTDTADSCGDLCIAEISGFIFDKTGTWTFALSEDSTYLPVGYYFSTDVLGATTGDEWFGYNGADLDNTSGTAGVTITNAAFPLYEWGEIIPVRDFNSNNATGLKIRSYGAVSVTSVLAFGNGQYGVNTNNEPASGTAAPNVNLTNGRYVANGDTGLEVNTRGAITAKNIGSAWNSNIGNDTAVGNGAHLVSNGLGKAISISNNLSTPTNYIPGFENSAADGLVIDSKGAVTLTNVTATYNIYGHGVNVDNTGGVGNLTINNIYLSDNGNDGLHVNIKGAISLNKAVSEYNGGLGAYLQNNTATVGKPGVTINNVLPISGLDYQGFNSNDGSGLQVLSIGIISLTNVGANYNVGSGASLQNYNGFTDIKVNNSMFDGNGNYGLSTLTRGNISFVKGSASDNSSKGASLEAYPGTLIKNIIVTGVTLNSNYGTGLYIRNNGTITLTNVQASGNYGEDSFMVYAKGADLNNCGGQPCEDVTTTGNVTIKNGDFQGNNDTGLLIRTRGNVTLTSVYANDNEAKGAWISTGLAPAKVVSISGMSTFYDNGDTGLEIYASGAVTLTNVDAAGNGAFGAYINNMYAATPANVSLLSTLAYWTNRFGDNAYQGLYIVSKGAVVLNKLDASGNDSDGVFIDNWQYATLPANVTINTGWYNSNGGDGLTIRTKGTVLVNGLEASYNDDHGASINNDDDATGTKSVTINKSTFNSNHSNGFQVGSHGNIILNNITASDNLDDGSGAYLYNLGGTGTVTVLNTLGANTFNNNANHGLWIASDLAVQITGVTASFNGLGYGIYVDNDEGTNAPVTLTKTTTNYNSWDGVYITSDGAVTLNSAVSMFNGVGDAGNGFTILSNNAACKTTISTGVAIGNGGYGIYLYKNGGTYLFTNTLYFGNDVDDGGNDNLLITDIL
jgi:hypothetical protein